MEKYRGKYIMILLAANVIVALLLVLIIMYVGFSMLHPYNKDHLGPFKVMWPWTDRDVYTMAAIKHVLDASRGL